MEVGQIVVVVADSGNRGDGGDYADGDVLRVLEFEDDFACYRCTKLNSGGGEDVLVYAEEVEVLEPSKVTILSKVMLAGMASLDAGDVVEVWNLSGNYYVIEGDRLFPISSVSFAPTFGFGDIRVGDRIRGTRTFDGGDTVRVTEGVVGLVGERVAETSGGAVLASSDGAVVLLDRPVVNQFEEAPVLAGAHGDGFLYVKVAVGRWEKLSSPGGWVRDWTATDAEMLSVGGTLMLSVRD